MALKGSRVPSLLGGPVPLVDVQNTARSKLVDIIGSVVGAKAIVFDPQITGPLGLLVPAAVLAEHGVEKMFKLGGDMEEPATKNIVYMVISQATVSPIFPPPLKKSVWKVAAYPLNFGVLFGLLLENLLLKAAESLPTLRTCLLCRLEQMS